MGVDYSPCWADEGLSSGSLAPRLSSPCASQLCSASMLLTPSNLDHQSHLEPLTEPGLTPGHSHRCGLAEACTGIITLQATSESRPRYIACAADLQQATRLHSWHSRENMMYAGQVHHKIPPVDSCIWYMQCFWVFEGSSKYLLTALGVGSSQRALLRWCALSVRLVWGWLHRCWLPPHANTAQGVKCPLHQTTHFS